MRYFVAVVFLAIAVGGCDFVRNLDFSMSKEGECVEGATPGHSVKVCSEELDSKE